MLTAEKLAVEVTAEGIDKTRRDLNQLGDEAGDGKSSGWAGRLALAGTAAFAAVGAAGAGVAGYGLKVAADTEQASIAFKTLLGPAADDFMAKLQTFAAATPFEFPELRDAASRLLAVGTASSEVIPLMTALGDATSAMGTGSEGIDRAVTALTQMQQKGKATGEEMLQLAEAGIPAWDALATVLHTDVAGAQQMVSDGAVSAQTVFGALETYAGASLGRVQGMMSQQASSLTGLFSTLKDTVGQGLAGSLQPAVESIKAQLPGLTSTIGTVLSAAGPAFSGLLSQAATFAGQLLPVLAPIVTTVADVAGSLMGALGPALTAIAPYVANIADLLGGALMTVFDALKPVLPQLAEGIGAMATALADALASGVTDLAPFFAELLAALVPLLPPLARLATTLIQALLPAIEPLLPPIIQLVEALVGTKDNAGPLVRIIDALSAVIAAIPPNVMTALATALLAVVSVGPAIGIVTGVIGGLGVALAILTGPIGLAVAAGVGLALLAKVIIDNWDGIAGFFVGIWDSIVGVASGAVDWLKDNVGTIGRVLLALVTGGMSELVVFFANNWRGMLEGAASMIGNVLGFFRDLLPNIVGAIGDIAGWMEGIGHDIVVGIWNGMAKMGSWLWDTIWGWVSDVLPGPVKWALGIDSPSKVMAELGGYAAMGLAVGMLDNAGHVSNAASALAAAALPDLGTPGFPSATVPFAGTSSGMAAALAGGSSQPVPVTLELDGRVLAQVLVDPMRGELIEYAQRTNVSLFGGNA